MRFSLYLVGLALVVTAAACDQSEQREEACNLDECFNSCSITERPMEAAGEACTRPVEGHEPWDCAMEMTCAKVVFDEQVEVDVDAAHCLLTALRDRTPGKLSYEWSEHGQVSTADVFVRGDGTVLVDILAKVFTPSSSRSAAAQPGQKPPMHRRFRVVDGSPTV